MKKEQLAFKNKKCGSYSGAPYGYKIS